METKTNPRNLSRNSGDYHSKSELSGNRKHKKSKNSKIARTPQQGRQDSHQGASSHSSRHSQMLFIGSVPNKLTQAQILAYLQKNSITATVNKVKSQPSKHYLVLNVQDSEVDIEDFLAKAHKVNGLNIQINWYLKGEDKLRHDLKEADKKIYIAKVPAGTTNEQLMDLFSVFGPVRAAYIKKSFKNSKNARNPGEPFFFGFVTFVDRTSAKKAKAARRVEFRGQMLTIKDFRPNNTLISNNFFHRKPAGVDVDEDYSPPESGLDGEVDVNNVPSAGVRPRSGAFHVDKSYRRMKTDRYRWTRERRRRSTKEGYQWFGRKEVASSIFKADAKMPLPGKAGVELAGEELELDFGAHTHNLNQYHVNKPDVYSYVDKRSFADHPSQGRSSHLEGFPGASQPPFAPAYENRYTSDRDMELLRRAPAGRRLSLPPQHSPSMRGFSSGGLSHHYSEIREEEGGTDGFVGHSRSSSLLSDDYMLRNQLCHSNNEYVINEEGFQAPSQGAWRRGERFAPSPSRLMPDMYHTLKQPINHHQPNITINKHLVHFGEEGDLMQRSDFFERGLELEDRQAGWFEGGGDGAAYPDRRQDRGEGGFRLEDGNRSGPAQPEFAGYGPGLPDPEIYYNDADRPARSFQGRFLGKKREEGLEYRDRLQGIGKMERSAERDGREDRGSPSPFNAAYVDDERDFDLREPRLGRSDKLSQIAPGEVIGVINRSLKRHKRHGSSGQCVIAWRKSKDPYRQKSKKQRQRSSTAYLAGPPKGLEGYRRLEELPQQARPPKIASQSRDFELPDESDSGLEFWESGLPERERPLKDQQLRGLHPFPSQSERRIRQGGLPPNTPEFRHLDDFYDFDHKEDIRGLNQSADYQGSRRLTGIHLPIQENSEFGQYGQKDFPSLKADNTGYNHPRKELGTPQHHRNQQKSPQTQQTRKPNQANLRTRFHGSNESSRWDDDTGEERKEMEESGTEHEYDYSERAQLRGLGLNFLDRGSVPSGASGVVGTQLGAATGEPGQVINISRNRRHPRSRHLPSTSLHLPRRGQEPTQNRYENQEEQKYRYEYPEHHHRYPEQNLGQYKKYEEIDDRQHYRQQNQHQDEEYQTQEHPHRENQQQDSLRPTQGDDDRFRQQHRHQFYQKLEEGDDNYREQQPQQKPKIDPKNRSSPLEKASGSQHGRTKRKQQHPNHYQLQHQEDLKAPHSSSQHHPQSNSNTRGGFLSSCSQIMNSSNDFQHLGGDIHNSPQPPWVSNRKTLNRLRNRPKTPESMRNNLSYGARDEPVWHRQIASTRQLRVSKNNNNNTLNNNHNNNLRSYKRARGGAGRGHPGSQPTVLAFVQGRRMLGEGGPPKHHPWSHRAEPFRSRKRGRRRDEDRSGGNRSNNNNDRKKSNSNSLLSETYEHDSADWVLEQVHYRHHEPFAIRFNLPPARSSPSQGNGKQSEEGSRDAGRNSPDVAEPSLIKNLGLDDLFEQD